MLITVQKQIELVCVSAHLSVSVVVNVAGRDHMTDGTGLHGHFLLHQQR